jgi:hypothetical protein
MTVDGLTPDEQDRLKSMTEPQPMLLSELIDDFLNPCDDVALPRIPKKPRKKKT